MMKIQCRPAVRLFTLALAVGLIVLSMVALAYGPAAPALEAKPAGAPTPEPTPTHFTIDNGTPQSADHPAKNRYEKLDSRLNRLVEEWEQTQSSTTPEVSGQWAPPAAELKVLITPASEDKVSEIARFLNNNGASPADAWMKLPNDGYGLYQLGAIVPVSLLVRLAELPDVALVKEPDEPVPVGAPGAPLWQGAGNPADAHGATAWHKAGYKGAGVAVGIIDAGYAGFSAQIMPTVVANGGKVKSLCFPQDPEQPPTESDITICENYRATNHGTSVSKAVLTTAPNVSLYISNPAGKRQLRYAVDWMVRNGVKVINMSMVYPWDGPGDGTSPFTYPQYSYPSPLDSLNHAVRGGITWVNAVGNAAPHTWFSRSVATSKKGWLDFAPNVGPDSAVDDCNSILLSSDRYYKIQLRWDDSWNGANIDLDLHLYQGWERNRNTRVAASTFTQDGETSDTPSEEIKYEPSVSGAYCLAVKHQSGKLPEWIQLQVRIGPYQYHLEHRTLNGSITTPSESSNPGMLGVGASSLDQTPVIRLTSGRGPVPEIPKIPKPDIVGGNRTELSGTSHTSPYVAGLAALVHEALATASATPSPAQVAGYLRRNASLGSAPNHTWGHGRAHLPALPPPPSNMVVSGNGQDASGITVHYTPSSWPGGGRHHYQFRHRYQAGGAVAVPLGTPWESPETYTPTSPASAAYATVDISGLAPGHTYQVQARRCAKKNYTICGLWSARWSGEFYLPLAEAADAGEEPPGEGESPPVQNIQVAAAAGGATITWDAAPAGGADGKCASADPQLYRYTVKNRSLDKPHQGVVRQVTTSYRSVTLDNLLSGSKYWIIIKSYSTECGRWGGGKIARATWTQP